MIRRSWRSRQRWCRDDPVRELLGDPGEDLGVLGAVGLQLGVPPAHVLLDRLGVERQHVLDDPLGLQRGQAGAGHQVVHERGIDGHDAQCAARRRPIGKFLPAIGQFSGQIRRRKIDARGPGMNRTRVRLWSLRVQPTLQWRTNEMTQHARPLTQDIAGDYTIDPSHTRLGFTARHAMVTKVRGQFDRVLRHRPRRHRRPGQLLGQLTIDDRQRHHRQRRPRRPPPLRRLLRRRGQPRDHLRLDRRRAATATSGRSPAT